MFPIISVCCKSRNQIGNQSQTSRYCNISCYVSSKWSKPEQIQKPNKEKYCKQIAHIFFVVFTYIRNSDIISHIKNNRFEKTTCPFRHSSVFLVRTSERRKQQQHQSTRNNYHHHVFGNR